MNNGIEVKVPSARRRPWEVELQLEHVNLSISGATSGAQGRNSCQEGPRHRRARGPSLSSGDTWLGEGTTRQLRAGSPGLPPGEISCLALPRPRPSPGGVQARARLP
jgi:hypothetical protein